MSAKIISKNKWQENVGIKKLLILALIIFSLAACRSDNTSTLAAASSQPPASAPVGAVGAETTSYADVVSRVAPAVVTIHSELRVRAPQQFPFSDNPLFNQLFGDRGGRAPQQQQPQQRASALGSGVIVSTDGYILTNHHVVDGAQQIKVDLNDNRTVDAKVVGSDAASDLAVLKINVSNLPVLQLGDSERVRVGDVALAIGNPLGVGQTVTMGIISAKGRRTGLSDGSFEDFLQTDAPINQGNSGGALVNTNGELVGINSQILSRTGGSIGIGFAIPSNMARDVMDQLIKTGKVRRGRLGVGIQAITPDIASSLNLKDTRGVLINQVEQGTPAERAGVKQGDIVTALNGTAIADDNAFRNQVARTQPGTDIQLTILRGGREQQLRATLTELAVKNTGDDQSGKDENGSNSDTGKLGLGVQPLTPEIAQQLNLRGVTQGLVVGSVDPNSPAAEAGIQQGDVILQANGQPVRSIDDLRAAVNRSGSRPTLLLINRRGSTVFVPVAPNK
ncbi:MAG: Do family serine endopeptidase [Pyrinomonadaceae bacterium]